jgi:miniconductance mechanosensitive channel
MEKLFTIKNIYQLYEGNEFIVLLCLMMVVFYPLLTIVKKLILPGMLKAADKKNKNYSKIFAKNNLSTRIILVFIAIYLMFWSDIFVSLHLMDQAMIRIKDLFITIYAIIAITSLLLTLLNIGTDIYKNKAVSKRIAIDLHMQIVKIIIMICAILAVISLVAGLSISGLFTSLGAAAALLTFIFKDTMLGLLASLQLTFQNIIQVGDWVTVPQYNADGDVVKITISIVTIRNFDKSYTTIPTTALLTTAVKNWRPMLEGGGRRIKRSINIDIHTIKICNQKTLDLLKKMPYMIDFAKNNADLFNEKCEITNVSMFRKYIQQFLTSNKDIHQEGFTFLIRELDPTSNGLPIELYIFTKDTGLESYESIQADIFDHLLAIIPQFNLKVFQFRE